MPHCDATSPSPTERCQSDSRSTALWLVELLYRVQSASRKLSRSVESLIAPQEPSLSHLLDHELLLLWSCSHAAADQSQKQLADALGISPPQISALVERLRVQGDLAAERSTTDRRRQVLKVTPQGSSRLAAALAQLMPLAEQVASQLTAAERELLPISLDRLAQIASEPPSSSPAASCLVRGAAA